MKTYKVVISETAEADLLSVYEYIAERANNEIAPYFVDRIARYRHEFSTAPERGARRDDLRQGLRTVGFRRRATILFEVDHDVGQVVIHGIYYAGRSFEDEAGDDDLAD